LIDLSRRRSSTVDECEEITRAQEILKWGALELQLISIDRFIALRKTWYYDYLEDSELEIKKLAMCSMIEAKGFKDILYTISFYLVDLCPCVDDLIY
jgi:hypothetical protein